MLSSITGFGPNQAPALQPEIVEVREVPSNNDSSHNKNEMEAKKETASEKSMTVEEYVRGYFSDVPILVEIAKCESRFRQYDKDGDVLRGEKNRLDRGVMQINEYYHNEDSEKLGFNILTLEGNTAYGRYLFEKYGVQPWISSSKCWGKTVAYSQYKNLAVK